MGLPETLHPGVYDQEVQGQPRVTGVSFNTGGFVGAAERGRSALAILVTSLTQFVAEFGDAQASTYLYDAVKGFFINGGSRCYVVRVVGSGAAAASITLDDNETGADDALTITLKGEGAYGNLISVKTDKFRTTLATTLTAASHTTAVLTSVAGLELGDWLIIENGAERVDVAVQAINPTTKTITFPSVTVGGSGISATGSVVRTSSQHRLSTRTTAATLTTDTQVSVASALQARVGQQLLFVTTTQRIGATVAAVNGNDIVLSAQIGAVIASGALVVSMEFGLKFYEDGLLIEQHDYLSMESANLVDYVVNRFTKDSKLFTVVDEAPAPTLDWDKVPEPVESSLFSSGADGTAPTESQIVGSAVVPKTGYYVFDSVTDCDMISAPGYTGQTAAQGLVDYVQTRPRLDMVAITETPLASDTPEEARDYRLNTLARDSSFACLYYPWIQTDSPVTPGILRDTPPSGHVQGAWALTGATRGIEKAPANLVVVGALKLVYESSDAEQDILDPIGVNCIRRFEGEGIKIWGSSTLSNIVDGRESIPARRLLNFYRKSIAVFLRNFVFAPVTEELYTQIQRGVTEFLQAEWRQKKLFPSNDRTRAFFVKCDTENNTDADRAAKRVVLDWGIQPPPPAKFIIQRASIFDGGLRFSESLGAVV